MTLGATVTTKNAVIAANRFGLGARPGDLSRIGGNAESWLMDQLQGPSRLPADIRSVFKGVLRDHLGIIAGTLERKVFPGSAPAKPMRDLIDG
jgi:uncharacterized protein (DUF1501 family)